jgi:Golgi apyrase
MPGWLEVDEGFALLIDAGSTGSRAFIYDLTEAHEEYEAVERTVRSSKGKKVMNGLSTYVDKEPKEIMDYLAPIFLNASAQIPSEYHKSTQVYIKGTAGMRLLPEEKQEKLWSTVVEYLNKDERNPFTIYRENLGTIDGDSEAYYAALSSNYIAKSIDGNLMRIPGVDMVGALDMGGSSTQVIVNKNSREGEKVKKEDFWSYSWINYGVEKVREKVEELAAAAEGRANPCTPTGYSMEHEGSGKTLVGSGDPARCYEMVTEVIWQDKICEAAASSKKEKGEPCYLAEVEHPPLKGKFYAMSVYFYALDAVQQLGSVELEHWPTPSLYELKQAVHSFCATDWDHAQSWLNRAHRYTQDRNVPNRCVESMYLVTLLEHAFGYDEHSRNITFALNIEGREVEWTLGFVLANVGVTGSRGLHRYEKPSGTPTLASTSFGGGALTVRAKSLLVSFKSLLSRLLSLLSWSSK